MIVVKCFLWSLHWLPASWIRVTTFKLSATLYFSGMCCNVIVTHLSPPLVSLPFHCLSEKFLLPPKQHSLLGRCFFRPYSLFYTAPVEELVSIFCFFFVFEPNVCLFFQSFEWFQSVGIQKQNFFLLITTTLGNKNSSKNLDDDQKCCIDSGSKHSVTLPQTLELWEHGHYNLNWKVSKNEGIMGEHSPSSHISS